MAKKIGIIFGSLALLILAAIIVIPLVVDVDQYRPQMVRVVNDNINGNFELGKLKLSLWGRIRIVADGLKLEDSRKQQLLAVNEAFFDLPYTSILGGSPNLTFRLNKPEIHAVRSKDGKVNWMSLPKGAPSAEKAAAAESSLAVPALIASARLSVDVQDATLTYKDAQTGVDSKIKRLMLSARDVSLTRRSEFEVSAEIDTQIAKTGSVRGIARLTGSAKPELSGATLGQLAAQATADFSELEIFMPGVFHKEKGVTAAALFSGQVSSKSAVLDELTVRFLNAELKGKGRVDQTQPSPTVDLTLSSNVIDFKPWLPLFPSLAGSELSGSGQMGLSAKGPTNALTYQGELKLAALTIKMPNLKAPLRFDAEAKIVTDQIERFILGMKAPGTDLTVKGNVVSFARPRVTFSAYSEGMDLDQLMDFSKARATPAGTPAASAPGGGSAPKGAPTSTDSDYDAMLEPLRTSPIAAATTASGSVDLKSFKANGIKLTGIKSKLSLKDLVASIDSFGFGLWKGTVSAQGSAALRPKAPTYRFSGKVAALDLNQAVVENVAVFKSTVQGIADFEIMGSGASFNPTPALSALSATGSFKLKDAKFSTIDVAKMTTEAINSGLLKLADKLPQARGKTVSMPKTQESKYEWMMAKFSIGGGKFVMPDFTTKAYPNRGIDLKGSTTLGLLDYSLATRWEVIDTFNLTKARDLSIEANGISVPHVLAEGANPVKFPVSAGCTAMQPCFSYNETPEYLAKVALSNVTKAATGRVKAEAVKKVQEAVGGAAPAPVQKGIENLKKRFGF